MNRRQWFGILGIGLFALIVGIVSSQWVFKKSEAIPDPAVTLFLENDWQTPEGKPINTKHWQGKILVVNFWGSWCPPCVEEMPTLEKLQQEFFQQNVLFIGIGIDSPSNIRDFLLKTPVSYPIANGGVQGSAMYRALGDTQAALPYTVVIDVNGKIKSTRLGKIQENDLRRAIKEAI